MSLPGDREHICHYSTPSTWGRLLKPVARAVFKLLLGGNTIDISKARKRLHFMGLLSGTPKGIARHSAELDGPSGPLNAEWLVPTGVATNDPVILYLHGGGYISGSIVSHRDLASRLVLAAKARCLVLDYRLAPEAPFPAALEDSIASWRWLLKQGIRPEQIVIAGDSAGGGLALATGLRLIQLGLRQPAGYYCLSPWTDLTLSGQSITERQSRELVLANPKLLLTAADAYRAGQPPDQPLLSPLWGALHRLAPLLIHVGSEEVLFDDSLRFHQRALAAGAESQLKIWEGMWHVWPLLHRLGLPEARSAMTDAGAFIQSMAGVRSLMTTNSTPQASPTEKQKERTK
ncbi:alpha/beta hydrolase [Spongiibacter sp. KMU-158]|uniref:Alpha/beta hydrolase n=1 Tax=Spongiibacter pelagi TaxID=2760804 RepID=A0A927C3I6_9GAMM|nr:alpha/beta hydrolase [Spongiibacter pelagi]MBD2860139.1 alpha/beta hydrolase [Spongiibacter pelagi]